MRVRVPSSAPIFSNGVLEVTEFSKDVLMWMKRLNRKGPFYLLRTEESSVTRYDHLVTPSRPYELPANIYVVIWNDGEKTKIGSFKDYMFARHGVSTRAVLNGETPFDLWNGSTIGDAEFQAMLAVRNATSELPHFDLHTLVGVSH